LLVGKAIELLARVSKGTHFFSH